MEEMKHAIFGEASAAEFSAQLEQLQKALGTGTEGDAYGTHAGDMSALRPQSLEQTLKVVTARDKHMKFWPTIGKKQAYNTVEEFNVLDSYGGDSSPFFMEGGLPSEEDSHWIRQAEKVKFLGTTRSITHPAQLVRNVAGDATAMQAEAGTQWILQNLERALYFADETVDPMAFNGLYAQVRNFCKGKDFENQHIIDLKGKPLDENILEDIATIIADNYGNPHLELHMTNQVNKDLSKLVYQRQRTGFGTDTTLGSPVKSYEANTGTIAFTNNVFLKPRTGTIQKRYGKLQKGSPDRPTVTGIAQPLQAVADATSKMEATTEHYFISARNGYGESYAEHIGSVAVADGQRVDITFNRVVSADRPATSYLIYRGFTSNVNDAVYAFEVRDDETVGLQQTISDRNFDRPGTDTAFLLDNDPTEVLCFKLLAPLMRLPLARISAAERFMILLYGMMQVYNPRRVVVIKNIGKLGVNSNRELIAPSYGTNVQYGTVHPQKSIV